MLHTGCKIKTTSTCFIYFLLDVLNVHLVDVVSGGIVFSMSHRKVKGPLNMVHSENWLVYSYYNDKVRRTEISMYILSLIKQSCDIVFISNSIN